MNIAVFASGRGTNFGAIIRAVKKGKIKANLALLVCDNPKAGAISRAKRAGIKIALVKLEEDDTLESLEKKMHKIEHRLYPEAIRLYVEGKLKLSVRKVKIKFH